MTTATSARTPLAGCKGASVVYGSGSARVDALVDVDFGIERGETVALWGRSGSGKTTLLHVIGGLVTPTSGSVDWNGNPLSSLDAAARGRLRAASIAYVFQGSNLLPHLSAYENVAFAMLATGNRDDRVGPPEAALELVGLKAKLDALPAELSGGEAQRVAIARALAQSPELLLCDEPTGHLDSDTSERVLDLIEAAQREFGFALVIATHDADVAARTARVVELSDGRVVAEGESS